MTNSASLDASSAVNEVLKNTYRLLSLTLIWAAMTCGISIAAGLGGIGAIVCMVLALVTIFIVAGTANSGYGLAAIFLFTGLMGASAGPLVGHYLSADPMIVVQALVGTAVITLTLSFYAVTTKKDFSYMGGFLLAGLVLCIVAMIANFFLQIPALSLAISCVVIMIMSAYILYDTSRIMNGGETNYILATMSLFLDIFNIFIHLLSIIGGFDD